jgi:MarR family
VLETRLPTVRACALPWSFGKIILAEKIPCRCLAYKLLVRKDLVGREAHRLEDCISFLLAKAGQQVARRARENLKAHGVTPTQYAVLKALWGQDGQSGAEIGARLVIDSATATGVLDRLQAAELVSGEPIARTGAFNAFSSLQRAERSRRRSTPRWTG